MTFYVGGLDLGQARDYTALGILEVAPGRLERMITEPHPVAGVARDRLVTFDGPPARLALRHLERYRLGTAYPAIVTHVAEVVRKPPGPVLLAVDATGVGAAVVDLFDAVGVPLVAITLTGGNAANGEGRDWNVPKRDVVHGLLVALQQERFTYAATLALAKTLVEELKGFQLKLNVRTGHDSYEAWREGQHDDLVLAVALAAWLAEQHVEAAALSTEAHLLNDEWARRTTVTISPV